MKPESERKLNDLVAELEIYVRSLAEKLEHNEDPSVKLDCKSQKGMQFKQILTLGIMLAGTSGEAILPAQSQENLSRIFISASGKTTIEIVQTGNWEKPGANLGSYNQQGGSGGYLVNTGQDDPMGFYTRFYDTSGRERCVGRMHIYIDDSGRDNGSRSTWIIDGTVPGYTCSTVGRTMELLMQQTQ